MGEMHSMCDGQPHEILCSATVLVYRIQRVNTVDYGVIIKIKQVFVVRATAYFRFWSRCCKVRLIAARAELDRNDGAGGRCESGDVTNEKKIVRAKRHT
jgi:hypothetical protein